MDLREDVLRGEDLRAGLLGDMEERVASLDADLLIVAPGRGFRKKGDVVVKKRGRLLRMGAKGVRIPRPRTDRGV